MGFYRNKDSQRAEMYEKKVENRIKEDLGIKVDEWDKEKDYYSYFEDGFFCEIMRTKAIGCLCGYVTLPKDHKYAGLPYDKIGCDIHGGLTYSAPDENGDWKIGFDCAHFSDIVPRFNIKRPSMYENNNCTYKNVDFVKKEISKLIEQIKAE